MHHGRCPLRNTVMGPMNKELWETVAKGEPCASGHELTCKKCRLQFKGGGTKILGHVAGEHAALTYNIKPCPVDKVDKVLRKKLNDERNAAAKRKRDRQAEEAEERAVERSMEEGEVSPSQETGIAASTPAVTDLTSDGAPGTSRSTRRLGRVKVAPSQDEVNKALAKGFVR